jgi:hypothetical protein
MWIFVILAGAILIMQIISSIVIYTNISKIPGEIKKDMDKVDKLVTELDTKLNQLNNLNQKVSNIESNIITLTNKYPPNQTININNMNQQELNRAINNAINNEFENVKWKINFSLILNSLVSFTIIIYLFFGRKR